MIVPQQYDLTSIEMFSRIVVRRRRFAMHQIIFGGNSRKFSSLTPYTHSQIEQKQPKPLSLGGLMNSNIRTQDALMIGIVNLDQINNANATFDTAKILLNYK